MHVLINLERSLLSKGLGFHPTAGGPDIGNLANDLSALRRKVRLNAM